MMLSSFCRCYAIPDINHFEGLEIECQKVSTFATKQCKSILRNKIHLFKLAYSFDWDCTLCALVGIVVVLVCILIHWDGVLGVFGIWDGVFVTLLPF